LTDRQEYPTAYAERNAPLRPKCHQANLLPENGNAQQSEPKKFTGTAWLDLFGGPAGGVFYPRYAWSINTGAGKFTGYGFFWKAFLTNAYSKTTM
jgi:hypothetical protein